MTNTKATAERNAEFEAMTPEDQRVTLANDVPAQLAAGKLIATWGTYFKPRGRKLVEADADKELSELLPEAVNCDVCAIGSLFFCAVMRADNIKVGHGGTISALRLTMGNISYGYYDYLERFFARDVAENIERLFEVGRCYDGLGERQRVPEEWDETAEDRMTWIMKNIAANNGDLVYGWIPLKLEHPPSAA